MMNGTTVYKISTGRLYLTCCGIRSPRLRWKMTAHRIRPQTATPTAMAAIHEPCQSDTVSLACSVSGARSPRRSTSVLLQPAVMSTRPTARAAAGTTRRRRRGAPRGWGLTDGLPSDKSRLQRPGKVDVLQPVVENSTTPRCRSLGYPRVRRPRFAGRVPTGPRTGPLTVVTVVYFDAAAAEPLHPVARETFLAALADGWADPARLHREGRRARLLLDPARGAVATGPRGRAGGRSFTASGTQAVHLGMLGAAQARQSAHRGAGHLVTSAVEHSSVLNTADWLAGRSGMDVSITGVDRLRARRPRRIRRRDAAGPDPARLPADGQQRGGHGAAGRGGRGRVRGAEGAAVCRCRGQRRAAAHPAGLVGAGRQRAQMGRPGRRWRTRGPQGRPLARAAARRRPRKSPGARLPERALGPGRGGRARRGGRRARPRRRDPRAHRPDPDVGAGHRRGRRGARRRGYPATAHRDVLVPVRGRRGASHRAGQGRLLRLLRQRLCLRHPAAQSRPGGNGRAYARQRAGIASPYRYSGIGRGVPQSPAADRGQGAGHCEGGRQLLAAGPTPWR